MNRIDRVTAMLIQLQSRKVVRAQELADRFGISLRTVYRDIKTLEEAGVPIIGESGIGYSIMEGYRLPPVMFTREEATAFLTAEKLTEKFTDAITRSSYQSAMFKVRAVLRSSEKRALEAMEQNIQVVQQYGPFHDGPMNNALQLLLKAISEKEVLHIRYGAFNSNEITERDIEPVGVFLAGGFWHTIGFCRLRNDYRDFRADRILQIHGTGEKFDKLHPTLKAYLDQVARKESLEQVVIRVTRETARYLQQVKYYYGFVSEKLVGEMIQMTFLIGSREAFIRWYLMIADDSQIVSPDSLLTLLKAQLENIKNNITAPAKGDKLS